MLVEIFEPYLAFITIFLTIILNLVLIFKNANWVVFVIANVGFMLLQGAIGLAEYNVVKLVLTEIVNIIFDVLGLDQESIDNLPAWLRGLLDGVSPR